MEKENIYNIPNLLSAYRLLMFPVILTFAINADEKLFAIFLCINLVTDILDGFIARTWKLATKFGAALDNLADFFTYLLAVTGIFLFKWNDIRDCYLLLVVFIVVFLISYIVSFTRFGKIPGMHLYSCVTTGYLQGIFFFILFTWEFFMPLYILALGFGIFAYIEKIIILLVIDDVKPKLKGLYWVMKKKSFK